MPTLSNIEKQRLERALVMGGGYVLSFSTPSFYEFFRDTVGIEIGHQRYERGSGSKANRMRAFWDTAEASQILRVLETLIEGWDIYSLDCAGADRAPLEAVVSRIRRDSLHRTVSSSAAPKRVEEMQFTVALSFPGLCRGYVEQIATRLSSSLGSDRVFYDQHYQAQLARPDLDTLLQRIYHDQSALIVVFLSSGYATSEWCGLEWRAVRDIIKRKRADQVMFVRFDDTAIEGALSIDGYIDARQYDPAAVSRFIIQRVTVTPILQPAQVVGTANGASAPSAPVCSDRAASILESAPRLIGSLDHLQQQTHFLWEDLCRLDAYRTDFRSDIKVKTFDQVRSDLDYLVCLGHLRYTTKDAYKAVSTGEPVLEIHVFDVTTQLMNLAKAINSR